MDAPFQFLHFNHLPTCRAWIDKRFEGVYALNYAHGGRIHWSVNGEPLREFTAPVAWWTWPGQYFTYGWKDEPGWDHRYVTLRGPWVEALLELGWFPSRAGTAISGITNPAVFCRKMDALLTALEGSREDDAWILLLELLKTLREEQSASPQGDVSAGRLRALLAEIREQPGAAWAEADAAQTCGFSAPHFRRLFRAEAGLPFWQFCRQERMALAASLLRRGELPIKEIAERCGIEDVYYFSRTFRQSFGLPPARFRAETRLANEAKK